MTRNKTVVKIKVKILMFFRARTEQTDSANYLVYFAQQLVYQQLLPLKLLMQKYIE